MAMSPPLALTTEVHLVRPAATQTSQSLTRSGARRTSRATVLTGPTVTSIRLHRRGEPSSGLSNIGLQGEGGAWAVAAAAEVRTSLQAVRSPGTSLEVCGLMITYSRGEGPYDTRCRVTALQLIMAGGQRLPETTLPALETADLSHEHLLPPDTRFVGLILTMGRPLGPEGTEEDSCLTDVQRVGSPAARAGTKNLRCTGPAQQTDSQRRFGGRQASGFGRRSLSPCTME